MKDHSTDSTDGKLKILISLMALFIIVALFQIYSLATDNWNCNKALEVYQEIYAREHGTAAVEKTVRAMSTPESESQIEKQIHVQVITEKPDGNQ